MGLSVRLTGIVDGALDLDSCVLVWTLLNPAANGELHNGSGHLGSKFLVPSASHFQSLGLCFPSHPFSAHCSKDCVFICMQGPAQNTAPILVGASGCYTTITSSPCFPRETP